MSLGQSQDPWAAGPALTIVPLQVCPGGPTEECRLLTSDCPFPSSQMGPDQKVAKLQSLPLNLFLEHCECLSLGRIGYGQRTKVPGKSCALEKERGQAGPGGALPEVIGNLLGAGLRVGRWV